MNYIKLKCLQNLNANARGTGFTRSHNHFVYLFINKISIHSISTTIHPGTLSSLLKPHHTNIVFEQRNMMQNLYKAMLSLDATQDHLDLIEDTMSRIEEVFMVVVVGEFNSGKSTFINSLLGAKYLKEGVLPTTAKICILRSSNTNFDTKSPVTTTLDRVWTKARNILLEDVDEMDLPVDWLQHIALIDTPGTNAVISKHEQLTQKFIPRADLILFVTSAERPLSESESVFLSKIKEWGKKVIMVVNKIDILQPEEKKMVLDYVGQNAAKLLGSMTYIPIFGVAARVALSSKLVGPGGNPALGPGARLWEESQLGALESYLRDILSKEELIDGKLGNVLGVADRLVTSAITTVHDRQEAIDSDLKVLELIDETLGLFVKDLKRDLQHYTRLIDSVILQLDTRCDVYLNERISIWRPRILLDKKAFEEEFARDVIIDVLTPINAALADASDMVCERGINQAKSVLEYVGNRPKRLASGMVGTVSTPRFEYVRSDLLDILKRDVSRTLAKLDQDKEKGVLQEAISSSAHMTFSVQTATALAAATLASAHVLDVTGVTAVSSILFTSFFVLPWQKNKIKREFSKRLDVLRKELETAVEGTLQAQVEQLRTSMLDSVAAYSRFVNWKSKS